MTPARPAPRTAVDWRWPAAIALYVALMLLYFRPLLAQFSSALPSDLGDPALNAWILWWNTQALPLTAQWWNAPIFFPVQGAFAFSETLLSMTAVSTPLMWAGAAPVAAYNAAFMVSYPLTAIAAYALAHRLTGRHDAALLAGLAFGFHPYRASQLPHIQLQWAMFMPLCLLALHRYLDRRRTRDLVLAGACWVLNALSCGYFLVFFAVLAGFWMLWFVRTRRDWIAIAATFAVASLALAPLLLGYRHYQSALGLSRSAGEIELFSADLSAIWAVSPHVWLPSHWTFAPRPEGELYQGIGVLILTLAGAWSAWRRSSAATWSRARRRLLMGAAAVGVLATVVWATGGWQGNWLGIPLSMTHPHRLTGLAIVLAIAAFALDPRIAALWRGRSTFGFYAIAAAVMFTFALGPVWRVFDVRFLDKGPYFWLMQLPGGSALRVPARFAMLMALCLSQTAAIGFARLTPGGARRFVVAGTALVILVEGWVPNMHVAPAPEPTMLVSAAPEVPVIELPAGALLDDTAAMLRSIGHRHPLVNGFSGFVPLSYNILVDGLRQHDASVLDVVRGGKPLLVVINRKNDPEGASLNLVKGLPNSVLLADSDVGPVYLLSGPSPFGAPPSGPQLAVEHIAVDSNEEAVPQMIDGDMRTRWDSGRRRLAGDDIVVTLAGRSEIAAVEMDLGDAFLDYPATLQVSVGGEGAPWREVWEGNPRALLLHGALRDQLRLPIVVPIPAGTTGRQVLITCRESDPTWYWSIRELRVWGRPVSGGAARQ